MSSFLPALVASSFGIKKPLLLDIEDNETWLADGEGGNSLSRCIKICRQYWVLRYIYAIQPLTKLATKITVVGTTLQKRYGGTIVLHGPDEDIFDPTLPELSRSACRRHFNLPPDKALVLFAGIPHRHKGLDILVEALKDKRLMDTNLVLAGPPGQDAFDRADRSLPGRVIIAGMVPNQDMPKLLGAVDIVPAPQRDNEFSQAQIPAKLFEAMAMSKSVVASRVSDLPAILGDRDADPRGWVFNPGDVGGLTECLTEIITDRQEAEKRAASARRWFINNAGIRAIQDRLRPLLNECLKRT